MYRSEPVAAAHAPSASADPATAEETPTGSVNAPTPSAAAAVASSHRNHPWLEAGANVLAFPVTVAVVAVVAPLMWMFGPRSHK